MTDLLRAAERRLRRRSKPNLREPREAYGRCVIESGALLRLTPTALAVRATGINYPGREHWATVDLSGVENYADALVVDLTARQFRADAPVPWTGTLVDWYDDVVDWLGDHLSIEVYPHDPHDSMGLADDPVWRDTYTDRDDVDPFGPMTTPAGLVTA